MVRGLATKPHNITFFFHTRFFWPTSRCSVSRSPTSILSHFLLPAQAAMYVQLTDAVEFCCSFLLAKICLENCAEVMRLLEDFSVGVEGVQEQLDNFLLHNFVPLMSRPDFLSYLSLERLQVSVGNVGPLQVGSPPGQVPSRSGPLQVRSPSGPLQVRSPPGQVPSGSGPLQVRSPPGQVPSRSGPLQVRSSPGHLQVRSPPGQVSSMTKLNQSGNCCS